MIPVYVGNDSGILASVAIRIPLAIAIAAICTISTTLNRGTMGLEIVFHEAMHQWDGAMIALVEAEEPLSTIWKGYLDGTGTRDEALSRLIAATSVRPER